MGDRKPLLSLLQKLTYLYRYFFLFTYYWIYLLGSSLMPLISFLSISSFVSLEASCGASLFLLHVGGHERRRTALASWASTVNFNGGGKKKVTRYPSRAASASGAAGSTGRAHYLLTVSHALLTCLFVASSFCLFSESLKSCRCSPTSAVPAIILRRRHPQSKSER